MHLRASAELFHNPTTQLGFVLPLLVSALGSRSRPGDANQLRAMEPWFALCLLYSFLSAQWDLRDDGYLAMTATPAFALCLPLLQYSGLRLRPLQAFALTFQNQLCAEIIFVLNSALAGRVLVLEAGYITGIGGAGVHDGLVIYPLVGTLACAYANMRRYGRINPPEMPGMASAARYVMKG